MLATRDIDRIVSDVAATHLPRGRLKRVFVQPYINSVDEERVRITLIVGRGDPLPRDGATIAEMMLDVAGSLSEAGETRTPTLSVTTGSELAHSGDPDA